MGSRRDPDRGGPTPPAGDPRSGARRGGGPSPRAATTSVSTAVAAVEEIADRRWRHRSGRRSDVEADAVVVAVGVVPRVELAVAAGAALGPSRAIRVDERLATSVPHVWAAGDCVENQHAATGGPAFLPLGSLANRQGRVLANVLGRIREDAFGRWRRPPQSRSSISTWQPSAVRPRGSGVTASVFAAFGSAPRTGPTTGPRPN